MDRLSATLHARKELSLLEQAKTSRQFYRQEKEADQYDKELGEFIWYIETGIRPASATMERWQQYQETLRSLDPPAPTDTEA